MRKGAHPFPRWLAAGRVLAAFMALATVGGCIQFGPATTAAPTGDSQATAGAAPAPAAEDDTGTVAAMPAAPPPRPPRPPRPPQPPGKETPPVVEPEVAAIPEVFPQPETMLGLGRDGMTDLLGAPGFLRRDSPAEIWQYSDEACILDVFLYEEGDDYRVLHFEVRNRDGGTLSRDDCFAGFIKAKRLIPHRPVPLNPDDKRAKA